jgi:hypothetical protein
VGADSPPGHEARCLSGRFRRSLRFARDLAAQRQMEERPSSVVEGALQRLCFGARAPVLFGRLGSTVIPDATRALRGEPGAIPGERAPLDKALEKPHTRVAEVPQGTPGVPQRQQQWAGREAASLWGGRHRWGAVKALTIARQLLASSAYTAPRRVTIEEPPQAVVDRSANGWQPVSSSRRRSTHSRSLSTLLAESGCSTRLASKSRVWTPRSHWRCRSNAVDLGGSCASKHYSDQLPDRRGQSRRQSARTLEASRSIPACSDTPREASSDP